MKAILVIDMPKDCGDCKLIDNVSDDNIRARCTGVVYARDEYHRYIGINDKPDWCPLKPLPQKKEVKGDFYKQREIAMDRNDLIDFDKGYNKCIDEILGEEE